MNLAERLRTVKMQLADSARRAGRRPDSVRLIAVSKLQPIEAIFEAHALGVADFGENTVQSLVSRVAAFTAAGKQARWHFIGTLQRNKVNAVLTTKAIVHTIDRHELAEAISTKTAQPRDVLVQVNIGREAQKAGVDPDQAVEFACAIARKPRLRLVGLMAIPPAKVDAEPYFVRMRQLSEALQATVEGKEARELSMGMSDDFPTAVACGATWVRVGTSIFGTRQEAAHSPVTSYRGT